MPANRSRTVQWRRCLQELADRNGSLELALVRDRDDTEEIAWDLVWRVRVFDVSEDEVVVEAPQALGQTIRLQDAIRLVAVIAIGQNRWMFQTTNLGRTEREVAGGKSVICHRLQMPTRVERCQRRNFYRVETAALNLPSVDLWPLLDPKSVVLAERGNELKIQAEIDNCDLSFSTNAEAFEEDIMPETGPQFNGRLLNLGGGGLGLQIEPDEAKHLNRHKVFWMRFSLPPELVTPICATGKLVHTHLQSNQCTYAGLAFDFSFNPGHQRFVIDQICRYIAVLQRAQLQRPGGLWSEEPRKAS